MGELSFAFHVALGRFTNVDLFHKGFYGVELSFSMSPARIVAFDAVPPSSVSESVLLGSFFPVDVSYLSL
jgi:hypothetical protein